MKQGVCLIDNCGRPKAALDLCNTHWTRQRKHGDPNHGGPLPPYECGPCAVDECTTPRTRQTPWCPAHRDRQRKHGSPTGGRRSPGSEAPECPVEGCDQPVDALGWCHGHYQAARQNRPLVPLAARHGDRDTYFWAKVDTDGPVPEHYPELGQCWVWTAHRNRKGYGMFAPGGGGSVGAHRWIWIREHGPIAPDLVIDHLCRNRACVRTSHMEPVTNGENSLRGETFAADNAIKDRCKRGHEFTEANTYRSKKHPNRRACRTCAIDRATEWNRTHPRRRT